VRDAERDASNLGITNLIGTVVEPSADRTWKKLPDREREAIGQTIAQWVRGQANVRVVRIPSGPFASRFRNKAYHLIHGDWRVLLVKDHGRWLLHDVVRRSDSTTYSREA
jgi:hypothetical protein